jgi:hypothetical protein
MGDDSAMATTIVRVLAGLGAVLICAWFAIGIRQANDLSQATALVSASSRPSPEQAQRAVSLLRSAGGLNPDRMVDIVRAQLDIAEGRLQSARSTLLRVVDAEPENVVAWVTLARAAVGAPRLFYSAAIHVQELAPPVHPPAGSR